MGNWRRAQIVGTCDRGDAGRLRREINFDLHAPDPDQTYHPLTHTAGLAGLPLWPDTEIEAVGNLAERGYTTEDVAECLQKLLEIAPSLEVKVHLGDDYESSECVATVVAKEGEVSVQEPEIEELPEIPDSQVQAHMLKSLL